MQKKTLYDITIFFLKMQYTFVRQENKIYNMNNEVK